MDGNVKELDNEIRNLTEENDRIQDALKDLKDDENNAENTHAELITLKSQNDLTLSEITDLKTNIIEISKRVRSSAGELSELNSRREILIHDNSALKQERFNNEIGLKSKERQLNEAKKEIDELERLLNNFNISCNASCTSLQ